MYFLKSLNVLLFLFSLQAVSLIASYLRVPLRYPLRLGGSRSYISDPAPSAEPTSSDLSSSMSSNGNVRPVEFSLFLEGQDTTRAAYAVFLLNKVVSTFTCHTVFGCSFLLVLYNSISMSKCVCLPAQCYIISVLGIGEMGNYLCMYYI